MATEILATGNGGATSSDVVIAAGSALTVGLKGLAPGGAIVEIELYDGASYLPVGQLSSSRQLAVVIDGPGTYRFRRSAGSGTCGVFSG